MAEFVMHCPYCGEGLTVQEEWLGMEGECPGCGKSFPIAREPLPGTPVPPEAEDVTPEAPSVNLAESFVFICPSCQTPVQLPGVMLGKPYTCAACAEEFVAMPATEKKCPFCGETIKFQATVCKHCRKHLSAPAPAAGAVGGVPQLQPVRPGAIAGVPGAGNIPAGKIIFPSPGKTRAKVLLWTLLWPGGGHFCLGQMGKGVLFAVGGVPLVCILGLLPLPSGITRLIFVMLYAYVVGDALYLLTKLQLGVPVGVWEWSSPGKSGQLTPHLSPEMRKAQMGALAVTVFCLLIGLTGPGILGTVILFSSSGKVVKPGSSTPAVGQQTPPRINQQAVKPIPSIEAVKQLKVDDKTLPPQLTINKAINHGNKYFVFIFPVERKDDVQEIFQKINGISAYVHLFKQHLEEGKRLNSEADGVQITGISSYQQSSDLRDRALKELEKSKQSITQAQRYHEQVKEWCLAEVTQNMQNRTRKIFESSADSCIISNIRGPIVLLIMEEINFGYDFSSFQGWYMEYSPFAPKEWVLK